MSMNVNQAMDTIGTALGSVTSLRVVDFIPDNVNPPAAVVSMPELLTYDSTKGRGTDRATFTITVLVGKVSARSARDQLATYMDGTAAASVSVKAALDAIPGGRCTQAEIAVYTFPSGSFLGADFSFDLTQ